MSTTGSESGSFGVRPSSESEGFTVNPVTGLPYSNELYTVNVRPVHIENPRNPDTGHPYTDAEIDEMPLGEKMHAMDFSSPAEQVTTVHKRHVQAIVQDGVQIGTEILEQAVHTHSAPKSGVLKYSVGRNRAYTEDTEKTKGETTVQTYIEKHRAWRKKMDEYYTAVQDWLDEGGRHSGYKKPKKPIEPKLVDKCTDKPTVQVVYFTGVQDIIRIMADGYGCTPEQCTAVMEAIAKRTVQEISGRPYTIKWSELSPSGEGYTVYNCAVPIGFYHTMMEALVECTPRLEFQFEDTRCTGVQYTPEQECYLEYCENVHRMFVHRRIDSNESGSQGFNGKTLYRTTREQTYLTRDNRSTRGRLYSACDREDIINRSFIMAFMPDICTLVPVTDEGHGYVQCTNVQAEIEAGVQAFISINGRTGKMRVRKNSGWWITYTDVHTGRVYRVFTRIQSRSAKLAGYDSIIACTKEECTSGQFGPNATELVTASVQSYSPEYPYSGLVKFVVRRLFEMLYKRPVTKSAIVWQTKYHRHSFGMDNGIPLYSIYKANEHLFSDVEKDIIDVELTPLTELVEMYKRTRPDERRAEMFRNLRYLKNGTLVHCGQKMYNRMAKQLFSKMRKMVESTDV